MPYKDPQESKRHSYEYNRRPEVRKRKRVYEQKRRGRKLQRDREFYNADGGYRRVKIARNNKWWSNRDGDAQLARRKYWTLRNNSKSRGKQGEVKVKAKDLRELLVKQKRVCALTGRKLSYCKGGVSLNTPSIDRVNSSKPYSRGNVRWVTHQANQAKATGTDQELLEFCKDVLKWHGYRATRTKEN